MGAQRCAGDTKVNIWVPFPPESPSHSPRTSLPWEDPTLPFHKSTPQSRALSSRLPGGHLTTSPPAATPCERHECTQGTQFSVATMCRGARVAPCPLCPLGSPPTQGAPTALLRPHVSLVASAAKGLRPCILGPWHCRGRRSLPGVRPALAHCTPSPCLGEPYITRFSEHTLKPQCLSNSTAGPRPPALRPDVRHWSGGLQRGQRSPPPTPARLLPPPPTHSPFAPLPFAPHHSSPSSGLN